MITLKNADVKLFEHDMSICHIIFNRDDQDLETLKALGRSNILTGYVTLHESIDYKGIRFYPH